MSRSVDKPYHVVVAPTFDEDLIEIGIGLTAFTGTNFYALRLIDRAHDEAKCLDIGAIGEQPKFKVDGIKFYRRKFNKYLIIYRIDGDDAIVEHVVSSRRDIRRFLLNVISKK